MSDHVCRYCGESFSARRRYVDHLCRSHDHDELRRIDRRIAADEDDYPSIERLLRIAYEFVPERLTEELGTLRWPVAPGRVLELALLGVALTCFVVILLALRL